MPDPLGQVHGVSAERGCGHCPRSSNKPATWRAVSARNGTARQILDNPRDVGKVLLQCIPEARATLSSHFVSGFHPTASTARASFAGAYSGLSGVFVEPREDGVKLPSSRFAVIWLPRGTLQEALLLMQTHPAIVGLARIGDRFGVR